MHLCFFRSATDTVDHQRLTCTGVAVAHLIAFMGNWGIFGVAGCERSGQRREKKSFRGNQMQCRHYGFQNRLLPKTTPSKTLPKSNQHKLQSISVIRAGSSSQQCSRQFCWRLDSAPGQTWAAFIPARMRLMTSAYPRQIEYRCRFRPESKGESPSTPAISPLAPHPWCFTGTQGLTEPVHNLRCSLKFTPPASCLNCPLTVAWLSDQCCNCNAVRSAGVLQNQVMETLVFGHLLSDESTPRSGLCGLSNGGLSQTA